MPNFYRLAVEGTIGPDQCVNVFHYRDTSSQGTPLEVITAWVSQVQASYLACITLQYNLVRLHCINLTTQATAEQGATAPGQLTADPLPEQCSAVISWRTGFTGRSRRGRTYVPPATEFEQSSGRWTAGYVALLNTYAGNQRAILGGILDAYPFVIYSRKLQAVNDVLTHIVRPIVHTQRRRVEGVGG